MSQRTPKEIAAVIGELARDAAGMASSMNFFVIQDAVIDLEEIEHRLRMVVDGLVQVSKDPAYSAAEHCQAG